MNVGRTSLLQASHVLGFNLAKAREIDFRHGRNTRATSSRGRAFLLLHYRFYVLLHIFFEDAITRA